jgi:hypothetical protein
MSTEKHENYDGFGLKKLETNISFEASSNVNKFISISLSIATS